MNVIEIPDINAPELDCYARLTEAQLKSAADPEKGMFIAESVFVIESALSGGWEPVSFLAEHKRLGGIESLAGGRFDGIPVYTAEPETLEKLTGYRLSRGILACMKRKPLPAVEELLAFSKRVAVLEGVTDPENIGAIFRSAAALGMDAVLVGANCCDPLYRRAARVSMGAVFRIPWTVLPCSAGSGRRIDTAPLHDAGFTTAAMALDGNAISAADSRFTDSPKIAVLLGSEGKGLDPATAAACDMTVMIPMERGVDSLNVAAAAAVAFFALKHCGKGGQDAVQNCSDAPGSGTK